MTNIEIKARELVATILNEKLPGKQFYIQVKGEFSGINYPNMGTGITADSEDIVEFLIKGGILILDEKLESSNGYPARATRFRVSYDQKVFEHFIDVITVGDFSLSLSTGEAKFKENKARFKPGSQHFKIFRAFLENPGKRFEYNELSEIAGKSKDSQSKEIQDLVNKEIKEKLDIPIDHFQADYGYMFIP